MRLPIFAALIAASLLGSSLGAVPAQAQPPSSTAQPVVTFHVAKVRGLDIFYREAGPANAPTILLLGNGSYGVLYAVAGVCAIVGAFAILPVRRVR